jgi:putative spermidine/putrescine transport system ATP-binding protein
MNALPLTLRPAGAAAQTHLVVDRVSKAFGAGEPVVRDVSFSLDQGQFMTLLGPSGSGKTTTLMMVAGFETPTSGRIFAHGRDVAQLPPNRRDFGVVFQGYALFPNMSVLDNVEFALRMRKVRPDLRRRRGLDMLDKVGLSAFADRRPRELSGGQQQRVALARALAFEPEVLLLDEPLGALDKKMRETLQIEIKDLQRKTGVSILFITHDQEEAMMMSDVIAVMENGRIAQIDPPEEIYRHPADPFVATFLGETNLLPCELCGEEAGLVRIRMAGGMTGLARPGKRSLNGVVRTTLSLRPEGARLLAPGETADTVVEAQVTERVFLGQQVRHVLRALDQTLVVVGNPAAGAGHDAVVGERVRIGWARDSAQLLGPPLE